MSHETAVAERLQVSRPVAPYGVGVDTHSKFIQVCVLTVSDEGEEQEQQQEFDTTIEGLRQADVWIRDRLGLLAAEGYDYYIESTGTYHWPVMRILSGRPHVVNPLQANPTRRKTDVLDAALLARQQRLGMWRGSFVPPDSAVELQVLVARRWDAKRAATRVVLQMRDLVQKFGHTFPSHEGGVRSGRTLAIYEDLAQGRFPKSEGVLETGLPPVARMVLKRMLEEFREHDLAASGWEQCALEFARRELWPIGDDVMVQGDALLKFLTTVPGVGDLTAVTWMAYVVDPHRFPNEKALAAYCGIDPSLKVSAGKVTSYTNRAGHKVLKSVLKAAGQGLLVRRCEPFGRWGWGLYKRKGRGGWRVATTALARRLCKALYHVHCNLEEFTYDGYQFWRKRKVDDVPVDSLPLSARVRNTLKGAGIDSAVQLAERFQEGTLEIRGFGPKAMQEVAEWLNQKPRAVWS